MRTWTAAVMIFLWPALACAAGQGSLAWLQDRNIFHSGLTGSHTVALTFDDGPNAHTAEILDVLKSHRIPATFFIVGRMAHLHPGILKRIAAEGHLLANHSASHAAFDREFDEDPQLLVDELRDVDEQIRPLMNEDDALFFRAPFGRWRPEFAQILNADTQLRHYIGPIFWEVGGGIAFDAGGNLVSAADWQCWRRDWAVSDCAEGYLKEIQGKDGGVVLLHAIHPQSASLLEAILSELQAEGFKFVRLDEVSAYTRFEAVPDIPGPVAMSSSP